MEIYKTYRYELKPNNKQITMFKKTCGVARFAYNWGLARRIELYKTKEGKERFTTGITQHKELNALKKIEFPWMYEVSKCAPQEALRDLDKAYSNMIRRIKNNARKIGKPKFKKKGEHDSFRYNLGVKVMLDSIYLPRIGVVNTKEKINKFTGHILRSTIIRESDRWFCSLVVNTDKPIPQPIQGDIVGIDLGLKTFGVVSNGTDIKEIDSPKPLKKLLLKLKRLHRQMDKKKKGSNNRKKAQLRLSRLYLRTKNIRKDFLAKESSKLAKTKSVIVIEDLAVSNMVRNHHLARSIGDEGWGEFKGMLEYKTKWYGSRLVVIPRFYPSSKLCNHCGKHNKNLKLSDRTWVCLNCGAINERDENAAKNIRQCGIEILNTESSSGINACGVDVRPSVMANDRESGSKYLV